MLMIMPSFCEWFTLLFTSTLRLIDYSFHEYSYIIHRGTLRALLSYCQITPRAYTQFHCIPYIPLRCENTRVGPLCWAIPRRESFVLGIPTCWYIKMLKFALPLTRTLKFALPPLRTPNTSRWNVAYYRSRWGPNRRGWHKPCRFHVVCLVFGRVGYPRQTRYPVEYRLNVTPRNNITIVVHSYDLQTSYA